LDLAEEIAPNGRDNPHDEMFDAVPMTTPTLALQICNPHILGASVVVKNRTHQLHDVQFVSHVNFVDPCAL
jgi:hypothetical protein